MSGPGQSPLDRPADWLSARQALERILATITPLGAELVSLGDALGRTLAENVTSPIDQPPWTNSAMDGFACRAEDVTGASTAEPRLLRVIEDVPAGGFPSRAVGTREAIRIMTGAPVPEGADSVVRLEHTHNLSGNCVAVTNDADSRRNLRGRGEDLRVRDVVLEAGRWLRPAEIGVLAAVGRAQVSVHRRARVAILSNGDELVDLDGFSEVLAGRRIVSSNSYALAAVVRAAGAEPLALGIARDTPEALAEHLGRARGADVLVTTAGASVGDYDLMKDALEAMGYELDFWRVRVQPGSPFSFGHLDGMPVFGLPGNPVSALVTFELFVRPALRRLHGRRDVFPRAVRVRVAERIESRPGRMRFLRVKLVAEGATESPARAAAPAGTVAANGDWLVRLTGPQGSGILTSMASADALLIVPLEVGVVEPGSELLALPLTGGDAASPTPPF